MEGTKETVKPSIVRPWGYSVLAFLETTDKHMTFDFIICIGVVSNLVNVGKISTSLHKALRFSVGRETDPNIEISAIGAVFVPNA